MVEGSKYPRVLIVLKTKVNNDDSVNILIRAQFGDWPKDRLAQIYTSVDPAGYGEFCGHYYCLQNCDRIFGGLFRHARGGVFEMVAMDAVKEQADTRRTGMLRRWMKLVKKRLGEWLINSGTWEMIFRVRISEPMARFIKTFKPELIYCQGYSLGFTTLPLMIARRFNIPICFQTTDDWPSYLYSHSPVGYLLRLRVRKLMRCTKVRLAFGEKMRREYERRYGVPFETTYHLDDPARFPRCRETAEKTYKIVYSGSLGHRRYEAIQDLLAAVRQMPEIAARIEIIAYSTGIPKDIPVDLLQSPEIKFAPLPTHEQLPSVLAEAAVLLLPESFNEDLWAIKYSMSSKIHLYMMSGRPILVYGPPHSGTVGYAINGGWAAVVTERNLDALKNSLWKLLYDRDWVAALNRKAEACIASNHDMIAGREQFRKLLAEAVSQAS